MSETSSAYQDASRDHEPSVGSALEGRERPILFSAPMIRALLAGTKTQTRRVVKPQPHHGPVGTMVHLGDGAWAMDDGDLSGQWQRPYGVPGDRLWVREAWAVKRHEPCLDHERDYQELARPVVRYLADDAELRFEGDRATGRGIYRGSVEKGRPSIHMPRWASRVTLRVADVRVERLQDISEADAMAEGLTCAPEPIGPPERPMVEVYRWGGGHEAGYVSAVAAYRALWKHINGPGSWAANPWVWCVSFERLGPQVEGSWSREELKSGERTS